MKKKLTLFLLTCFLVGCSSNDDSLLLSKDSNKLDFSLKSYPSTENWETLNTITLPSGITVNLPWSSNEVTTDIPKHIREDIASKDGWLFVFSNINNSIDTGNYIIFYNKFTGILKAFYYLESTNQQNNGIWDVRFEGAHSLLNGVDHFTVPITSNFAAIQNSTILNISFNNTHGFSKGWNCFQTPLTFDPSYNLNTLKLSITTYNKNNGTITLSGNYESSSKGSIISTTSSGNLLSEITKGMITQTGEDGKEWLTKSITNKVIRQIGANIITAGVPSMVSAGLNLVFGSFIGSSSTTQSTQSLQFSTNGSIEMTGETSLPTTGIIPPKSNIVIDSEERLGTWNLEKDPIFYLYRYTTIPGKSNRDEPVKTHDGYFQYPGIKSHTYKVKLNPDIENSPQLESWSEISQIVRYEKFLGSEGSYAIMPSGLLEQVHNISDNTNKLLFDDTKNRITQKDDYFLFYWSTTGRPGDIVDLSRNHVILKGDHVLKVTVQFNININGKKSTIYSTKTFRPKYEWAP